MPEVMPQACQLEPEPELKKESTDVLLSERPVDPLDQALLIYAEAATKIRGWPAGQSFTRTDAARDAGLSSHQTNTVLVSANIPAE